MGDGGEEMDDMPAQRNVGIDYRFPLLFCVLLFLCVFAISLEHHVKVLSTPHPRPRRCRRAAGWRR